MNTCGSDSVPPIGVPPVSHHSLESSESWREILGLIAAPLVGNATTVPPLQKRAVQCNAVSRSGSQSDTNTPLRVTGSLSRLRDSVGKSRVGGLSSGQNQSPTHTALSATWGSVSQFHACEELPEIIAAIERDSSRLDSIDTVPRLVDDDTSSGEESEDESRPDSTMDSARAPWKSTGKSVCALLHATDIGWYMDRSSCSQTETE